MTTIYDFTVRSIDGQPLPLVTYAGKVVLIVNVASRCGFTPQYAGLEALYRQYAGQGLVILGFPCNQFGYQEPASDDEIKTFCSRTYEVSFPMFAKVEVNGDSAEPLYQYLKSAEKGVLGSEAIKWNFTKVLVDGNGQVLKRYAPTSTPESLAPDIEALLLGL